MGKFFCFFRISPYSLVWNAVPFNYCIFSWSLCSSYCYQSFLSLPSCYFYLIVCYYLFLDGSPILSMFFLDIFLLSYSLLMLSLLSFCSLLLFLCCYLRWLSTFCFFLCFDRVFIFLYCLYFLLLPMALSRSPPCLFSPICVCLSVVTLYEFLLELSLWLLISLSNCFFHL